MDYFEWNRANWDDRATGHAQSAEYDLARFRHDPAAISDVVAFDLPLLGDIAGQRAIHLQCHIGTDTLSLARLGAEVSGVDLSGKSLQVARDLASEVGAEIQYHECNVYDTPEHVEPHSFDLVYVSIGALCWLPRIAEWAAVVAGLLKPGGRLFIRDMHPMLATLADPRADGLLVVAYPYFETDEPSVFDDDGDYVETDHRITATKTAEWGHGLGEIVTALLSQGMRITGLTEHRSVPFTALGEYMSPSSEHPGEWVLNQHEERVPLTFTLTAVRGASGKAIAAG